MNTPKARSTLVLLVLAFALDSAAAVASSIDVETPPPVPQEKKWYEERVPTAADFDAQAAEKRRRKYSGAQEHDARSIVPSRSIDRL